MGYNTIFTGELKFTNDLTGKELGHLTTFLGEDARDHKEWKVDEDAFNYIDLRLLKDFSGIQWDDETEKTYGFVEQVNFIIKEMRKIQPNFGLEGIITAQGEDYDDRWMLKVGKKGHAYEEKITLKGKKVTCPNCEEDFNLED